MRDAVPLQHFAVNTGQQLGIPELDPVTKVPWQLLEKVIELVSPIAADRADPCRGILSGTRTRSNPA